MGGNTFRVTPIAREGKGGGKHREMVHARQLPYLLHVARDVLGAVVDSEAVVGLGSPPSGDWVEEPVRVFHVPPHRPQQLPSPCEHLFCQGDYSLARLTRHGLQHVARRKGSERGIPSRVPGRRGGGVKGPRLGWNLGRDLSGGPPFAPNVVGHPPPQLGGGHLRQSPETPFEINYIHGPAPSTPTWLVPASSQHLRRPRRDAGGRRERGASCGRQRVQRYGHGSTGAH